MGYWSGLERDQRTRWAERLQEAAAALRAARK
jgi:hypothetical protein